MRVLVVVGTRPEAIKLAPVIQEGRAAGHEVRVIATGQHVELVHQALALFGIVADRMLECSGEHGLARLLADVVTALGREIEGWQPSAVLVQGDTSSALGGALAGYYSGVPVGHVEAGLRSHDLANPFPEEGNRRMIAQIARWHFAPTRNAVDNLLREGVDPDAVLQTGNTVVDALRQIADDEGPLPADIPEDWVAGRRIVTVTAHRRESWGPGISRIASALRQVALARPDVAVVFPVHPNPSLRAAVEKVLHDIPNVRLVAPLDYASFVAVLARSYLVVTDSGGVQEEAPCLQKPVLVTRDVTERQEGVEAGCARLVGTDTERIASAVFQLLDESAAYEAMIGASGIYGDGLSARRIVAAVASASVAADQSRRRSLPEHA